MLSMKMLRKIIAIVIGFVFVFSALAKLFDFVNTVNFIMSVTGLTYSLSKFGLLTLTFCEIVIGFAFIFNYWRVPIMLYSTYTLIAFFILVNIVLFLRGYSNCGCFGTLIESSPIISLIKNLLIIIYLIAVPYSNNKSILCPDE